MKVFAIPLHTRFRGITVREGVLLPGDDGRWGEWSPFLEYDARVAEPWLRCAEEAAAGDWPAPVRDRVPVNVTVPGGRSRRGPPDRAPRAAAAPPRSRWPSRARRWPTTRHGSRRCATRSVPTRLSASTPTAPGRSTRRSPRSPLLDRAAGGLEYVEQPCASVEDLAAVRRRVDVPIAADESIRRAEDPYRVRDLEAADVAVLKVQPLGGVRACLRIAEDIGLPVVVSSALETSVGIAAGLALAAALPELPYACGLATVQLLTADVAAEPLLPVDGFLPVGAATVDPAALDLLAATPDRVAHWEARLAEVRGVRGRDQHRPGPGRRHRAARGRGDRRRRRPGLAERAAVLRGVRRRRGGAAPAAHPDRRAQRGVPGTRALPRSAARAAVDVHVGHRGRQPAPGAASRRCTPASRWSWSPPTVPTGCAARAPTRPPSRSASSAGWCRCIDVGRGRSRCRIVGDGPLHLNVQLDEPLVPADRWVRRRRSRRVDPRRPARPERRPARPRPAHRRRRRGRRRAGAPGCSPRRPAGRCSPSRPAAPATARNALRCYRLLLDGDLGQQVRAGRRGRAPDAVPAGHPAAVARRRRGRRHGGWTAAARSRWPGRSPTRSSTAPTTRPGSRPGRTRTGRSAAQLDALLAGGARPDAVRRRGCGQPRGAARRPARRRCVEPDPRPRPDGDGLRRRRAGAR